MNIHATERRSVPPRFAIKQMGPALTLGVYGIISTIGLFSGGLWAIAGIALALLLALASCASERKLPKPDSSLLALALLALALMASSTAWSASPSLSIHESLRLATIFLPLILLTSPDIKAKADSDLLFPVLALALMIGALALGLELRLGGPAQQLLHRGEVALTKYNRGLTYAILLAFPAMAWIKSSASAARFPLLARASRIKRSEIMLAIFIVALLFPAGLTESRSGKLALVVGLAITLTASLGPLLTTRLLTMLPATLLAWPYAARTLFMHFHDKLDALPPSWHHRMEIWDYLSWRILEKPWLGWGVGTSHILPFREPNGPLYEFATSAAMHPHNVVTELWVELGLPGVALGMMFAWWTLKKAASLPPALAPFALGAWSAALCLSLIAYNFWTDSLFAAFALTGFAFSLLDQNRKRQVQNGINRVSR